MSFEQLEDRRVLTVFSFSPLEASDDGFVDSNGDVVEGGVEIRAENQSFSNTRGVLEIDLATFSVPPGETITSVGLQVNTNGVFDLMGQGITIQLNGYVGDGAIADADFAPVESVKIGEIHDPNDLAMITIDLDVGFVEGLVNEPDPILGINFQALNDGTFVSFASTEAGGMPTLLIVTAPPSINSVSLEDGVLNIEGSDAKDKIHVFRSHRKLFVRSSFLPLRHFDLSDVERISINTHGGNDKVWISPWVNKPANIDVGSGNDHVFSGSGNDLINAGEGNDRVWAGAGDDVVVGGAGNDHINGGWGRDLLIGGLGADYLKGAFGSDILIGGNTSYDADPAALDAIMAEWTSSNSYQDRVANLSNGVVGSSGTVALQAGVTVFDDNAKDHLKGDSERDWYFAELDNQDGNDDHVRDRSSKRRRSCRD